MGVDALTEPRVCERKSEIRCELFMADDEADEEKAAGRGCCVKCLADWR